MNTPPACPDPRATLGQWSAYVAAGKTKGARALRLAECPEDLRPAVASHVRTVWALRRYAQRRAVERSREAG